MSLSDNIKRLRLEKNLTQEQLSCRLGVSAQAISKWETSETYPDGALLVPLAKELDVSLDELFDNNSISMADISQKIISLLKSVDEKEKFNVSRDLCWQIERGLFNRNMKIENKYNPNDIKNQHASSYILDDYGFTIISNGKEPFFSVFPEPKEGFGDFLNEKEVLQKTFEALSRKDTINALIHLYRKCENYVFESVILEKDCEIENAMIDQVMEDLLFLKAVWKEEVVVNDEKRTLYYSIPNHKLIGLFLMAKENYTKDAYTLQIHHRNKPFIK